MFKNKWTTDMYMAAALISYGAMVQDIDSSDEKRKKFMFSGLMKGVYVLDDNNQVVRKDLTVDEFEKFYISKKILFPSGYPDSIKQMKSVIYNK